ncbi:MAG: histone deacetylase family protein [Paracoccaceae bacterium]|nr:histone deacetylase family protein [Paracoccaceae bacterium]
MKVFWSRQHAAHQPEFFIMRGIVRRHHERPERVGVLLEAARAAGLEDTEVEEVTVDERTRIVDRLIRIHDPAYVEFILEAHARWAQLPGAGPEIIPGIRAMPPSEAHPEDIAGLSGRFLGDMASPIGAGTAEAALSAVKIAGAAASEIACGARLAYALCRPPGHHAAQAVTGGGCYFSNIAAAIAVLRGQAPRVAVLDIDAHHGNGTQSLFWERTDVLTVSVHADPANFYPFYWGYAHETGGAGAEGLNLNLPVPVGSVDGTWLDAVKTSCAQVRDFAPDVLVVALGQDPHEADLLGAMRVTNDGFARAGALIAALGLPVLVVQEGGYLSPELGTATTGFLTALQAG